MCSMSLQDMTCPPKQHTAVLQASLEESYFKTDNPSDASMPKSTAARISSQKLHHESVRTAAQAVADTALLLAATRYMCASLECMHKSCTGALIRCKEEHRLRQACLLLMRITCYL
jgi:hypothetical protein